MNNAGDHEKKKRVSRRVLYILQEEWDMECKPKEFIRDIKEEGDLLKEEIQQLEDITSWFQRSKKEREESSEKNNSAIEVKKLQQKIPDHGPLPDLGGSNSLRCTEGTPKDLMTHTGEVNHEFFRAPHQQKDTECVSLEPFHLINERRNRESRIGILDYTMGEDESESTP